MINLIELTQCIKTRRHAGVRRCVIKLFFRILFKMFLILTILVGCATTEEVKETDSVALLDKGIAIAKKGQYDKAISDYTKAIGINPRHALIHLKNTYFLIFLDSDTAALISKMLLQKEWVFEVIDRD